MRSNALLTICSSFLFATAMLLWLLDGPSASLASAPGYGYRCANTPAPFWTMAGECRCVATPPHDFCDGRMPSPNSTSENIDFRYCTDEQGFTCNLFQTPCGNKVWNCQFASCNAESEPLGTPENPWGCNETQEPLDICNSKFYSWCDPVQYP